MSTPLAAPIDLHFDYTRSTGPVLSAFLTAVRDGRFIGARIADGRVVVPAPEYDPGTGAVITEFVDVSSTGTVLSYAWQDEVQPEHLPTEAFAWALVQLDGADTPILHVVTGVSASEVSVGMRVQAAWVTEPTGHITDFTFVPADASVREPTPRPDTDPVSMIVTPISVHIEHSASAQESEFLRGLKRGELIGARIGPGHPVYIPPRGASPTDGIPTNDFVPVADTGTVTTFCIVNVPFLGQKIKPPYVSAYILLDGADIAIQHVILECDAADVRMGMRVAAKWRPTEEWGHTMQNIEYFRPTGEPDADYDSYRHHL